MVSITQTTELEAQPSIVWKLLTDTTAWPRYAPVRSVVVERPGNPDFNGVGQIRAITTWAGTIREEVTAFEPEHRLEYTLLSGAPVRNYRGAISLEPSEVGTRQLWDIRFDASWFLVPILTWVTRRMVRRTTLGFARELRSIQ